MNSLVSQIRRYVANHRIVFLGYVAVWLLPSLYLTRIRLVDPFFWWPLSDVAIAVNHGQMSSISADMPAYPIIIYILSSISGLPPMEFSYLPVGAMITPICYFVLAKRLFKSELVAFSLATYSAWDFSIYSGNFNAFAYAWTTPLFILLLFFMMLYFLNRTRPLRNVQAILLIFLATYFLHPTYAMWVVMSIVLARIALVNFGARKGARNTVGKGTYLAVSLVTMFLAFNRLFYDVYLKVVVNVDMESVSDGFMSTIRSFIGLSQVSPMEPHMLPTGAPTQIIGYATFVRTGLILLFVLCGLGLSYRDSQRRRTRTQRGVDFDSVLVSSIIIVGVIHVIGYALYGHMSLRFVGVFYPIAVVLLLRGVRPRGITTYLIPFFLASLLLLAVAQSLSYELEPAGKSENVIYETQPGSEWLSRSIYADARMLSDFHTSQVMFYYFAFKNRTFDEQSYDSSIFESVIGLGNESTHRILMHFDYIIVNQKMSSTPSISWKIYEPLRLYNSNIASDQYLSKIYDDMSIWVLIPVA